MSASDIAADVKQRLGQIAESDDFARDASKVVKQWQGAGVGIEVVEAILHFIEEHPDIDCGTPGPLVHFIESIGGGGYHEYLYASLRRKPTDSTVWMLNRIINVTRDPVDRARLIRVMEDAETHADADDVTRDAARDFLRFQRSGRLR